MPTRMRVNTHTPPTHNTRTHVTNSKMCILPHAHQHPHSHLLIHKFTSLTHLYVGYTNAHSRRHSHPHTTHHTRMHVTNSHVCVILSARASTLKLALKRTQSHATNTHVWMGLDSFLWYVVYSRGTWRIHMGHDSFILNMTHSFGTWPIRIYLRI